MEAPGYTSVQRDTWWKVHKYETEFDYRNGGNDASTEEASGGNLKFRQEFKDVIAEYPGETAEATLEGKTFWRRRPGEQTGEMRYPWENPTQVREWN